MAVLGAKRTLAGAVDGIGFLRVVADVLVRDKKLAKRPKQVGVCMAVLLILLVVVGILFFIAKTRAEARMTAVDTRRAVNAFDRGTAETMPTWSFRETETLVFFDGVRKMAERNGVPEQYIHDVYSEPEPARKLLLAAGEMETEGRSFTQQQLGVTELLSSMWNRLPSQNKQKFKNAPMPR